MTVTVPDVWLGAIRDWAREIPAVEAIYLFGSYARGAQTAQSDLDIGVVVSNPDGEALSTWITESDNWAAALQDQLPVKLDLQLANPDLSEAVVGPAVRREGVLIFKPEK
ncbi:MAG: nucleotidyltransferase domain-containing protein [Alphaproteobacteria bacterium]